MTANPTMDEAGHSWSSLRDTIGPAADRLKSFVEKIERLEEEKASALAEVREVYAEAKSEGFSVKVMRKIIARRKRDRSEQHEEDELIKLYLAALGEETL